MDELRRFIVEKHEAVQSGDLERTFESLSVVEPKFSDAFREAAVRAGADELTLRRGEECTSRSFIDTPKVGDSRWGPPLDDEDWHAVRQASDKGPEERERLCHKYADMHKAVNGRKPGNNHKTKTLWMLIEAKTNGGACCDWSCERHIVSGTVRQALWEAKARCELLQRKGQRLWRKGPSLPPRAEAKRGRSFPNERVKDDRCVCSSELPKFGCFECFPQCGVSVAAFVLSPQQGWAETVR